MIVDTFERYLHDRSVYVAEKTLVKYRGDMKLFLGFLEEKTGIPVAELPLSYDFNIFQEFILHLRKKDIRNVTIRSYCRSVKAFLRWCYDKDLCPDYMRGVKLPRDDSALKLPLYREEVACIDATFNLNTEQGRRNYCIVHLMLDCGLRTQEVVALRRENVLRDKNIIVIINSKGEKSRMTLIPDFLLDAIDAYCSIAGSGEGYLFRDLKRGERVTANAVRLFLQDLKKVCGVSRVHAHLLRHTFATSYLIGGGNLEFLRVFMGHTDYAVTKMYSKLAAEYKMLGADIYRLDDIFFTRGY